MRGGDVATSEMTRSGFRQSSPRFYKGRRHPLQGGAGQRRVPRPLREPAAQIYSAQRGRAISVVHFPNHRVTKAPYVTRIMGTRRIFEQMPG